MRPMECFSSVWSVFFGGLAAERLEEEQKERDQQHVDDQRLDQDEAQDERASHIAGCARVARNRLGRRADCFSLPQRRESCRDTQREAGSDDLPFGDLEIDRLSAGALREEWCEHTTREDQCECQDETFTHDPNLL